MTEYNLKYQQIVHVNVDDVSYELNFVGNVVSFDQNDSRCIKNAMISAEEGFSNVAINVSSYVKPNIPYFPVAILDSTIAEHFSSYCVYTSGWVSFYYDGTELESYNNTVILIPITEEEVPITGITNGIRDVKSLIGNGTITLTQGGATKGTFTTNQSGNSTIALDGGTAGIIAIEDFIISEPVEGEEPSEGKQSISTVISDSRVEAEKSYLPIFVSSINQRYMSCYLLYHTGTGVTPAKTVEMFCYHTTGVFRGFRGTLYLIPIETDEDGVIVGSTNGLYDCTESTGYTGDIFALNSEAQTDITTLSGYDATATQILKNINGTLTWVTEE